MTDDNHDGRYWRTSSYSGSGNNCVQVACTQETVTVRDSKHPNGPELTLTTTQWRAFTAAIKNARLAS